MDPNALYRPFVIGPTSAVQLYGSLWEPSLYLPVMWETNRLIKGLLLYCDEVGLYTDAPEDIQIALEVLREQIAARPLTQQEVCGAESWGADFRIVNGDELQARQGPGLPIPPWEWRLVPQQDGGVRVEYRSVNGGAWADAGAWGGKHG